MSQNGKGKKRPIIKEAGKPGSDYRVDLSLHRKTHSRFRSGQFKHCCSQPSASKWCADAHSSPCNGAASIYTPTLPSTLHSNRGHHRVSIVYPCLQLPRSLQNPILHITSPGRLQHSHLIPRSLGVQGESYCTQLLKIESQTPVSQVLSVFIPCEEL